MALLDYCQYKVLNAQADSLARLETLLRSATPNGWSIACRIKRLHEKAAAQAYITTEETVEVFASILRECRNMGPNAQEAVQADLEPLVFALGLSEAVNRAEEVARELTGRRSAR